MPRRVVSTGRATPGTWRGRGARVLDLDQLLRFAVEQGSSDVHVKVGSRPRLRIDGHLSEAAFDTVEPADTERIAAAIMSTARLAEFQAAGEADFMYGIAGLGRFRVSVFRQRGWVGLVLRRVLPGIPGFEALTLPAAVRGARRPPAGSRARDRARRIGEDRDVGGDGRSHQHVARVPHRHHRRPGRGVARRQASDRRPARGRDRHADRALRARARAAPGPRRDHGEPSARCRDGMGRAAGGRDRAPRARVAVDHERRRHRRPAGGDVRTAPPTPGARAARDRAAAASCRSGCSLVRVAVAGSRPSRCSSRTRASPTGSSTPA